MHPSLCEDYADCKRRVETMRLISETEDLTHPDRLRHLNNFATFEYPNMVCALGCLLRHIDETRFADIPLPSKSIFGITIISA